MLDACLNGLHYSQSGRTELPGNVGGDEEDADHIPYSFFSVDRLRMGRCTACMKGICASVSTLSFQANVVLIHHVSSSHRHIDRVVLYSLSEEGLQMLQYDEVPVHRARERVFQRPHPEHAVDLGG